MFIELIKIVNNYARPVLMNVPSTRRLINEALPSDLVDMSKYLKKHWNGPGRATAQDYLLAYLGWN